ncbi:hypothetical protein E4656_02080 [Natronospirillum operosum]|uniref:Uncharacterized protein n=1 Tax=Natronospirillum operosum TaxID=2759953 RepID=A0A4Z0WHT1_9GAMM|nr:hypothetical protein [Natronospirillum operosum]TGG95231.1 hypothetical protein E4656_02080 [Natronospirillum operosum]
MKKGLFKKRRHRMLSLVGGVSISLLSIALLGDTQVINIGDDNIGIGSNTGTISIDQSVTVYPEPNKIYRLRNPGGGNPMVLPEPRLTSEYQPCRVFQGTPIALTGSSEMDRYLEFVEVTVLEGNCAGQTGWVTLGSVSIE